MAEHYRVRMAKDYLVFSAAHFITFDGNHCERLHGHNYRVSAEVAGPLDENQYVVDFIALRDALRSIVDPLDHHMLLPNRHPRIRLAPGPDEVEVTFEEKRWIFPIGDCMILPLANTTSELLARHLAHRLIEVLGKRGATLTMVRVEIDECFGNVASCQLDVPPA